MCSKLGNCMLSYFAVNDDDMQLSYILLTGSTTKLYPCDKFFTKLDTLVNAFCGHYIFFLIAYNSTDSCFQETSILFLLFLLNHNYYNSIFLLQVYILTGASRSASDPDMRALCVHHIYIGILAVGRANLQNI